MNSFDSSSVISKQDISELANTDPNLSGITDNSNIDKKDDSHNENYNSNHSIAYQKLDN